MSNKGLKVSDIPHAIRFWDTVENVDIDPATVAVGSDKKYHWSCDVSSDHRWMASPKGIAINGNGCPFCSNRRLSITNSLSTTHPELATEFASDLNGLMPNEVIGGSDKKYWWRCHKDDRHVWIAGINKRSKAGRGCPYCSGHKVLAEESFKALFPQLMAEWDWDKNKRLDPAALAPKSDNYAWWVCLADNTHSWKAKINNRANGTGCPYCLNRKVSTTNSLAAVYPTLASQFDLQRNFPLTPEQITSGSTKACWWKCEVNPNHRWEASPYHRRGGENGCPFCSIAGTSKPELRLFAELSSIFKNVEHRRRFAGFELDLFIPELNVGIEYDGAFFHRERQEKDLSKSSALQALGIPVFRVRERPLDKLSDLDILIAPSALLYSDIVALLHLITKTSSNLLPDQVAAIQQYSQNQTFVAYDEYLRLISEGRQRLGTSLSDTHHDLVEEWDHERNLPLIPQNFSAGSRESVYWICTKHPHHKWQAPIANRALSGTGCPYCAQVKTAPENSFKHDFPAIALEWHPDRNKGLDIDTFSANSQREKVWWQCCKNPEHEWEATVKERCMGQGLGCPFCGNKRISPTNNLAATHPLLAQQWHPIKNHGLSPEDVFAGGKRKVWWQCPVAVDHEWQAALYSRSGKDGQIKNGCPFCSGLRASSTHNLQLTNPELVEEWAYTSNTSITPLLVTRTSDLAVSWVCATDSRHKWKAPIKARARGARCPFCTGKETLPGCSLDKTHPELLVQWDRQANANPIESFSEKSAVDVWWICPVSDDHRWKMSINKRALPNGRISECPFCKGKRVALSNAIASTHPELAEQWHPRKNSPLTPEDVTRGSGKRVWWKCPNGDDHIWETRVCNRAGKDGEIAVGCPFCAGQRPCRGNNLQELFPLLMAEWDADRNQFSPAECLPYTNRKFWWVCARGHSWEMSAISRTKFARGCPVCNK